MAGMRVETGLNERILRWERGGARKVQEEKKREEVFDSLKYEEDVRALGMRQQISASKHWNSVWHQRWSRKLEARQQIRKLLIVHEKSVKPQLRQGCTSYVSRHRNHAKVKKCEKVWFMVGSKGKLDLENLIFELFWTKSWNEIGFLNFKFWWFFIFFSGKLEFLKRNKASEMASRHREYAKKCVLVWLYFVGLSNTLFSSFFSFFILALKWWVRWPICDQPNCVKRKKSRGIWEKWMDRNREMIRSRRWTVVRCLWVNWFRSILSITSETYFRSNPEVASKGDTSEERRALQMSSLHGLPGCTI